MSRRGDDSVSQQSTSATPTRPAIVTVIGSESTGKTTLVSDLGRHFDAVWVPEFARTYADHRRASGGGPLDARDIDPIARGQISAEDNGVRRATSLLILDTDLVSTMVYAAHYYGSCPPWIEQAARERLADLYLVADIDVPWVPDGVRDRPHLREHIHDLFVRTIAALGSRSVTIRGSWDDRRAQAIRAVERLLRDRESGRASRRMVSQRPTRAE